MRISDWSSDVCSSDLIDIYSLGSVLLGQSRVFTTFGGDLFIWSAEGDINAGRGSRSTAVYQPPRRVYDLYGNVTLSRSEARRVGKECVSTGRSWWSPVH